MRRAQQIETARKNLAYWQSRTDLLRAPHYHAMVDRAQDLLRRLESGRGGWIESRDYPPRFVHSVEVQS